MKKAKKYYLQLHLMCRNTKRHLQTSYQNIKRRFSAYWQRNWKDTGTPVYWAAIFLLSLCAGMMAGTFMLPYWAGSLLVSLLAVPFAMLALWLFKHLARLLLRNGITEFLSWLLLWFVCTVLLAVCLPEGNVAGAVAAAALCSAVFALLLKSIWAYFCHKARTKTVAAVLLLAGAFVFAAVVFLAGQGFEDTYINTYLEMGAQQRAGSGRAGRKDVEAGKQGLGQLTAQEKAGVLQELEDGPYTVMAAAYGTGSGDALGSGTVNISRFAQNEGIDGFLKERYQGYPLTEVPLSGMVWYPKEVFRCPTLFIAHGNHNWITDSYLGYGYLGAYLASHGYVVVSVDENACNGLSNENDGRAVLLLENIRQIERYNRQERSPLYKKIDEGNLALAGHSRGGEAIATAYLFNGLDYYPENGNCAFRYHFSIKSLAAIAPTCGQYRPSGRDVELKDVNYLVLHGANDQDVFTFMGMEQYENVAFTGKKDCIKASLYLAGANHGQFNSLWGKYDLMEPVNRALNVKNFISEEEQQQVAKLFLRAFLDETLECNIQQENSDVETGAGSSGNGGRKPLGDSSVETGAGSSGNGSRKPLEGLLTDYRKYQEILPRTLYVQSYQSSSMETLCNFEEDARLETGTAPGVLVTASHVDSWREQLLYFSNGEPRGNHAAVLRWEQEESSEGSQGEAGRQTEGQEAGEMAGQEAAMPELTFSMPEMDLEGKALQFDVMDLQEGFSEEEAELLGMELVLEDSSGREAAVDVGEYCTVYPSFLVRLNKLQYLWGDADYKHQFQTVSVPADSFAGIDQGKICKVTIRFSGKSGKAAVDNVGIQHRI